MKKPSPTNLDFIKIFEIFDKLKYQKISIKLMEPFEICWIELPHILI